jgi:hypothetical protein
MYWGKTGAAGRAVTRIDAYQLSSGEDVGCGCAKGMFPSGRKGQG